MQEHDSPRPRLTSPERVVYPGAGITKQQVADYYRALAPRVLEEVARRPLSMLRCPRGVDAHCFFQKHHRKALGPHVHPVELREKDGGEALYVYVDDLAGLLELVQMNVIELHPWPARIDALEQPDRLVFDLDPGDGVAWTALVDGAREIRKQLRRLGLRSFVRLSGGKGLHVVVPIAPDTGWERARAFVRGFAETMAAEAPERFIATASKEQRRGLVFIDWLRNTRGATSVASWSLRARPGAGVAMPLRWDELGKARSGADYDLVRAIRRAERLRREPWDGWMRASRQALPGAS